MSNLETAPAEVTCAAAPAEPSSAAGPFPQVLDAREVPLGGPQAMTVRRTLPQRARSLIGGWCFADHYGPDDVSVTGGMRVAGHPHTGLQTASWLFQGEVEHMDTTGVHAFVRPGELNLMTAGSGIAHSEYSTPATTMLRGVQLWIALPGEHRFAAPGFEHYVPPEIDHDGARILVFLGRLLSQSAPVRTYSPLLGAEITLDPGRELRLPVDPAFEHGVLVDTGGVAAAGAAAGSGQLLYLAPGAEFLRLRAGERDRARFLLLGGAPLGERIVMWWNFIGRTHDEIVAYRAQWQAERAQPGTAGGRFGRFPERWEFTLPAPDLPNIHLRPRG